MTRKCRNALTARQEQALAFMVHHLLAEQRLPTLRALGDAMGATSSNGMHDAVEALIRKGYLERTDAGRWRIVRHPDGRPFRLKVTP